MTEQKIIKQRIEQEAEKQYPIKKGDEDIVVEFSHRRLMQLCRKNYNKGATFYEQSILPEVLKEKDELVIAIRKARNLIMSEYNELMSKNADLVYQLSQLQSSMEEEKRKAFEAAREKCYAKRNPMNYPSEQTYPTYDDYLKSSTQSTESGNLNTK